MVCRWALPLGFVIALLAVPLVAATADLGAIQEDVQQAVDVTQKRLDNLARGVPDPTAPPPSSPPPSAPGSGPSNPGSGGSEPGTQSGPMNPFDQPLPSQVPKAVAGLIPEDTFEGAGLLLGDTKDKVEEVPESLPPLPALPQESEGQTAPPSEPSPQTQATKPAGSLLLAGSILAVGATAAAATYVVLWLAGSSTTVSAGAATSELRRLLPFASPLFTRFERDTVLGHPRREQIYARILQEPGISLQDLGTATGLSRTAVVHHLRLLEQQHLVISRRVGRSRHYFENGGRYGHDQKEAYALLRNDRSKAVAEFIRNNPGTMQKSLCAALAIPPSIAHWHVRRLQQGGLVETIRQGRAVAYFPGASMATVSAGPQFEAASAAVPT